MKTLVLSFCFICLMSLSGIAQKYEHFRIDTTFSLVKLSPLFDKLPNSGVNGYFGTNGRIIKQKVVNTLQSLPKDLKQHLRDQDVTLCFYFNSKGEVFHINFLIPQKTKLFMNDAQWMQVYKAFQKMKFNVDELGVKEDFEWGSGGIYPISKYLREMPLE